MRGTGICTICATLQAGRQHKWLSYGHRIGCTAKMWSPPTARGLSTTLHPTGGRSPPPQGSIKERARGLTRYQGWLGPGHPPPVLYGPHQPGVVNQKYVPCFGEAFGVVLQEVQDPHRQQAQNRPLSSTRLFRLRRGRLPYLSGPLLELE